MRESIGGETGVGRWCVRSVCLLLVAIALLVVIAAPPVNAAPPKAPVVLAAASLQPAMEEVGRAWAARGHPAPVFSFAASSTIARQVEAGAPADLFLSADEEWADYLQQRGFVAARSRVDLLGNRLALVAAKNDTRRVTIRPGVPLTAMVGSSRLAVADTESVPAGRYAKAALVSLRVWDSVAGKLAPAENVRAALAMVERGLTPLGIVYATDAKGSAKVRLVGLFPAASHPPIRYPMVTLARSRNPEAQAFRRFLMSPQARAIFVRHGFVAIG